MNLKLFQQECAKRIVFVLRDFDFNENSIERISETILQDITQIWDNIKKPEKFNSIPFDKFFEVEFITLPHIFYFKDKFDTEINSLRSRLDSSSDKYLFNHVNKEKNVPADGLAQYVLQMWNDIIGDKDLNIVNYIINL